MVSAGCIPVEVLLQKQLGPGTFAVHMPSGGSDAVLHVSTRMGAHVAKCSSVTLVSYSLKWIESCVHLHIDMREGHTLLLHPTAARGPFRDAELFGGIGGWTHASVHATAKPIAVVEINKAACDAYAATHGADVMEPQQFLDYAMDCREPKTVVVYGSINDPRVWSGLSILNVSVLLISPPCQPWSTMGKQGGLAVADGELFATALEYGGLAKVHAIAAENVPGLTRHPDFPTLTARAAMKGMVCIFGELMSCQRALPLARSRWLGSFVHASITVDSSIIQATRDVIAGPDRSMSQLPGPSLLEADAIHVHATDDEKHAMQIPKEALEMMRRSDMIPKWLAERINWTLTDPIMSARTILGSHKMSGVVARYGEQHTLPVEHLVEKGLRTVAYGDDEGLRLFSPWEMLAALGFPPHTKIAASSREAYQQVGNAISPYHAWMQIVRTHHMLGHLSPFHVQGTTDEQIQVIVNAGIKLSQWCAIDEGDLRALVHWEQPSATMQVEPDAKRLRVDAEFPATVPFAVNQPALGTRHLPEAPNFFIPANTCMGEVNASVQGGIVKFLHAQKHWMVVVHGTVDDMVSRLMQRALPHAKDEHFVRVWDKDGELLWSQNVKCVPSRVVNFEPAGMTFLCAHDNGDVTTMSGDTTWTISTMKAYAATMIQCNVDSLMVQYNGLPTNDGDFLAEYEKTEFRMKFKATMPGYHSFAPAEPSINVAGLTPKDPDGLRFVAMHPAKKIIRTVYANLGCDIATVVRLLFPDMVDQIAWTLSSGGTPLHAATRIDGIRQFNIDWRCFRPFVPTVVSMVELGLPLDSAAIQVKMTPFPQRWIKSPFSTRASLVRVDERLDLKQIAASYVAHTKLQINITCQIGGQVLDPDTVVNAISNQDVLAFKFAPLLGGGKNHSDKLRDRIKTMLSSRGVGQENVTDRTMAFLNKADVETLQKAMGNDDDSMWAAIKDEANRVHFRLVYRNEMKAAKQEGRSKPSGRTKPKHRDTVRPKDDFIANAANIQIDIDHFWDGDSESHVPLLDASRFGQDQTGIAIMSCDEANKHAAPQSISPEPLAILVVGKRFAADDECFMLPAYIAKGLPIVVKAALRQYGDRPVAFRAAVPNMEVGVSASTVCEIHILRQEVVAWKECSIPLHYLGVQISAMRGSSIISTWSMRSYNDQRQPCSVKDSAYWHGYVRISDEILEQVLARSGWNGIYVTPRSPDKRFDDRFAAVTLPDGGLVEAQRKAATIDHALGIVRIRDQYGIRCKREHPSALRAQLLPEAAYVSMNSFDQADSLWILKNVPTEVGQHGLSEALRQAEWQAKPVRAQGQNRWLVAGRQPPPAKHLCINNTYVLIEPAKRPNETSAITMVAKQVKIDTVVSTSATGVQVAQTSRISEIKAEVSEHVEARLVQANERIEQLQQAPDQVRQSQVQMAQTQQTEMTQLREEQAFARQKIAEVETTVVNSGQSMLTTMQDMMQNMQSNLEKSMRDIVAKASDEDPLKRARTDQPPREDPFASKC
eukprot:Skav211609  [mRNA]  locus=scaffold3083:69668:74185:- [translate_table: standard]